MYDGENRLKGSGSKEGLEVFGSTNIEDVLLMSLMFRERRVCKGALLSHIFRPTFNGLSFTQCWTTFVPELVGPIRSGTGLVKEYTTVEVSLGGKQN